LKIIVQPRNGDIQSLEGFRVAYTPRSEFKGDDHFIQRVCGDSNLEGTNCSNIEYAVTVYAQNPPSNQTPPYSLKPDAYPPTTEATPPWPGPTQPWVGPTNRGYAANPPKSEARVEVPKSVEPVETRVKLHPHNGLMMVDVIVGGVATRMMLDTGAGITVITKAVASQIRDNGQGHWNGTVRATMSNGRTEEFPTMYVKKLRIGPHTVRDLTVSVSPGALMLLPFPVVNGIGPFTIDTQTSELIWRKRG